MGTTEVGPYWTSLADPGLFLESENPHSTVGIDGAEKDGSRERWSGDANLPNQVRPPSKTGHLSLRSNLEVLKELHVVITMNDDPLPAMITFELGLVSFKRNFTSEG